MEDGSRAIPRPLQITELCLAIFSEVDDPRDLVSMALTSRRFLDICLGLVWETPYFNGSPLACMLHLFPDSVREQLQHGENLNARVPTNLFTRFDYYARFIRNLTLWHHGFEEYLARVLTASRPGVWLFPALEDLHLGASGDHLHSVPRFLSPSLKSLQLNHWNLPHPVQIGPTPLVKVTLTHVCRLPMLERLDLMDTRYTHFETDQEIVVGFVKLAHQLHEIRAYSFIMVRPIFFALAQSSKLRLLFMNLAESGGQHVPLVDVFSALRQQFRHLQVLCLACTVVQATRLLRETHRALEGLELRIDSLVPADQLHELITTVLDETPTLKSFRISADSTMFCDLMPPIRLSEVFHPFVGMNELRDIHITINITAEQTMHDVEIITLFSSWPHLRTCVIESDPDDASIPCDAEDTDYGLTLEAVAAAATWCPRLRRLALPYVNTVVIPEIPSVRRAHQHFSLQISRSHIHNGAALVAFIASIWPRSTINVGGCSHFESTSAQV